MGKTTQNCKACDREFSGAGNRLFCSLNCRRNNETGKKRAVRRMAGYGPHLTTSAVGATHELMVAASLMKLGGLHIYRALDPSSPCDFMVYDAAGGRVSRLEVTTGHPRVGGQQIIPTNQKMQGLGSKYDVLAVVHHSGSITYYDKNGPLCAPGWPAAGVELKDGFGHETHALHAV